MTFPATERSLLVEMQVGSTWTDITTDVYQRDYIDITRGKANEASQASPQTCRLTLDNRLGKYSLRNPLSPYYGQIGRNTQLRVGIKIDPVYDAYSSTSGTGDLSWTHTPVGSPTGVLVFVWQYNTGTGQIASVTYGGVTMERKIFGLFTLGATSMVGYLYWLNQDIPTGPQTVLVDTTAVILRQASAISLTGGTHCEFDNSSFAYSNAAPSANPAGSVTTSKVTRIFASLFSELDDGSTISPGTGYSQLGEHDIGTETVAVEQTQTLLAAATWAVSWTAASAHWGIMAASIRAVKYRFWGEVSSFPGRWDTSGNDAYVPIEASGILRRLGQGTDPAETGLRAFTLANQTGLNKYWPLSGAAGTTYSVAVNDAGSNYRFFGWPNNNYAITPGGPSWAYGEPLNAFLGTGVALFNDGDYGYLRGDVGAAGAYAAVDFVFQSAALGSLTFQVSDYNGAQMAVNLSGPTIFGQAGVSYTPAGGSASTLGISAVLPELADGLVHHCRFSLLKNGTGTDWAVYIDGVSVISGTQAAYNVNGMSIVQVFYARGATESWVVLGHVTVWCDAASQTWPSAAACALAAFGYVGETAGVRVGRVAALAGVGLAAVGTLSDTEVMGPQYSEAMLTQLRDAEGTDLGILTEPRDRFGLLYRTHRSLYNQVAKVTLQYDSGHLAPPFEPVDDDLLTRNDITAVRREGDSYRLRLEAGALSVLEPPNGVGRYKDEVTVNVQTDAQLPVVASWLLHLGTLDEARFPSIKVNLANPDVVAAALEASVLAIDIGDQFIVHDAAAANFYDDITVVAQGYNERLNRFEHEITFNCAPGSSYEVISLDDVGSRIGGSPTYGTYLTAALNTTATSLTVITGEGSGAFRESELWTTTGPFPIPLMMGGEEITLTAVVGAVPGATQTFTVTRSVNGVVKSHPITTQIRLKRRAVWAL